MMPEAFISHRTSNRLRLKIPSHRGDVSYFGKLRDEFSRMQAFETLDVNPLTGSILFANEGIDVEAIRQRGEEAQFFQLRVARPRAVPIAEKVVSSLGDIDEGLRRFTGGDVDLANMAFLSLVGIGIYQICRGNLGAMPWYTAFWYALGLFTKAISDKLPGGSKED
ncbi:MAG TPA: hypothetical protein EYP19_04150 [Desulfobacterales bacterium]|nr:hypothetical protein [Desulfobacterales bacterium]